MPLPPANWIKHIDSLGMTYEEFIRRNAASMTDTQIHQVLVKHGFVNHVDSIVKKRSRMGIAKTGGPNTRVIGESIFTKYDSPPVVESDRVVILPDTQFPYHHHEFLNRVLQLCEAWNVKSCVLAGDVIENSSLTHFDPNWDGDSNTEGVPDEIADALLDAMQKMDSKDAGKVKKVLEQFGRKTLPNPGGVGEEWKFARKEIIKIVSIFEDIVWTLGNHEGRMLRQIQSPMMPEDVKKLFVGDDPKVRIGPYYYCLVKSGGETFRIIHPRSSARGDAQWYASKYLQHVIMAHSHHLMFARDRSGRFYAIETGCIVDEERLPYTAQRDTKMHKHLLGATIIRDGKPWLLYEDSPWDELMRI